MSLMTTSMFQEGDLVFSTTLQRPAIIAAIREDPGRELPRLYLVEYDEPDGRPNSAHHLNGELLLIWREGMQTFNPVVVAPLEESLPRILTPTE